MFVGDGVAEGEAMQTEVVQHRRRVLGVLVPGAGGEAGSRSPGFRPPGRGRTGWALSAVRPAGTTGGIGVITGAA